MFVCMVGVRRSGTREDEEAVGRLWPLAGGQLCVIFAPVRPSKGQMQSYPYVNSLDYKLLFCRMEAKLFRPKQATVESEKSLGLAGRVSTSLRLLLG